MLLNCGQHASLTILAQVARGEDVKSLIAEAEKARSTRNNDRLRLERLIRSPAPQRHPLPGSRPTICALRSSVLTPA